MIPFNDISYAQGSYNMQADPNPMIMMKASGFYTVAKTGYLDSQLDANYANAKACNKIPFMYHFAGGANPVIEASYFISAVSPITVGDGYALDFEIDTADNPAWVLAFLNHFTAVVGTPPWFYVDRSRRQTGDWSAVKAKYGEWIAAPDVPFSATIPNVGVYIAQQGPIVNGHDTDMFFGTLEELKAYTHQAPAVVHEQIPVKIPSTPATVTSTKISTTPLTPPLTTPVTITPTDVTPAPLILAATNPIAVKPALSSLSTTSIENTKTPPVTTQDSGSKASTLREPSIENSSSWWTRFINWLYSWIKP